MIEPPLVTTAEICDANPQLLASGDIRALPPVFQIYGQRQVFSGPVVTLKVFEDDVLVRKFLEEKGDGQVLVVDGGGSLRCALLGGMCVLEAQNNGWAGIVVYGCIRHVDEINGCDIGVRALASHPVKANKKGIGEKHVSVTVAGTRILDGEYLYADTDGILISNTELNCRFEHHLSSRKHDVALVTTAQICDANPQLLASGDLRALQPVFQIYGQRQVFSGQVVTLKVFEDNVLVREFLEDKGNGRVLVVDGGGSLRCAILGENPVVQAQNNGWAGIVVYGCIRYVDEINNCDIGVRALASHPVKANNKRIGKEHVPVTLAGTRILDGEYLYADTDGILISNSELN